MFLKITNNAITINNRTFEFEHGDEELFTDSKRYEKTISRIDKELYLMSKSLGNKKHEDKRRKSLGFIMEDAHALLEGLKFNDEPQSIHLSVFENGKRLSRNTENNTNIEEAMKNCLKKELEDMEDQKIQIEELVYLNSSSIYKAVLDSRKTLEIKQADLEVTDIHDQAIYQSEIIASQNLRIRLGEDRRQTQEEKVEVIGRLLRIWLEDRPIGSIAELSAYFSLGGQKIFRNFKEFLETDRYWRGKVRIENYYCVQCSCEHFVVRTNNRKSVFRMENGHIKLNVESISKK